MLYMTAVHVSSFTVLCYAELGYLCSYV